MMAKQTETPPPTAQTADINAASPQGNTFSPEGAEPTVDRKTGTETPTVAAAAEDNRYQDLQDQYVRLQADFQNYRKRMDAEKDALLKYGAERTLTSLLPILDNLSRGTASLSETSDPKLLYQSFNLVFKQLMDGLDSQGLKKIESVGKPFDPFYHEAVQHIPSLDQPENHIVAEAQAGFLLHDRVLRPALVVVSSGKPDEAAAGSENPFTQATDT